MDIEISFDEPGELSQRALLAMGHVDSDTVILLSDMYHNIIQRVYHLVLDVVAPQVYGWTWGQSFKESASDHNKASVTMNRIESPHQERNFHTVTEDDVQASLGDSLHLCLGEMLDVAAERSDNQLLQLVAGEVAKEILETCLAQNLKREAAKGSLTERQSSKQSIWLTSVTPFESEKQLPQEEKTRLSVVTDNLLDQTESPEVAPARELTGQQQEAARKPLSFVDKVWRYFKRRSSKQTPACEVDTCKVARLDNASTPLCQKKHKRPAIIGMLSAVAQILRKTFICNCVRSQDDN
ncbi:hypothetical protein VZT92_016015 [Zoarces viviparus]|uniref:Uncharacterized protein n=1 Tax=Zoarces viviparus TaxID=48416 RepID=A0AAW1ERA7_ZOAVI